MSAEDIATVLEAIGDSWPAAIVVVAGVAGFVALRALPRLNEIRDIAKEVRAQFSTNGGSTARDQLDRIEALQQDHSVRLAALEKNTGETS
uniref:hypothetical protein n=1 Tax=Promicromonospora sp. CA-291202 TaxID=3240016 RepID=UPI003F497E6E